MDTTPHQAKCFAHELLRRCPPDSPERLAGALVDAQVDIYQLCRKSEEIQIAFDGLQQELGAQIDASMARNLGHEQLQQLSDEVGPERTLLVLCSAFRGKADRYPNLTVKKIPKQVLARCEWGHDDYSLQVENLPKAPPPPRPAPKQRRLFEEDEP